jgi:hypothetical protein
MVGHEDQGDAFEPVTEGGMAKLSLPCALNAGNSWSRAAR